MPTLQTLTRYGFALRLEIDPRVWEKGRILRVVYHDGSVSGRRIEPAVHFPLIMAYIVTDAVNRFGYDVDRDTSSEIRTSSSSD